MKTSKTTHPERQVSQRRDRQAKVVATVGPSSSSPEILREMFYSGVDVFRLNFSHGHRNDHAKVYNTLRAIEGEAGRPIAIMQDLQGPKIRIGEVTGAAIRLDVGKKVRFVLRANSAETTDICLPHPEVFAAIRSGDDIFIDDGRIKLKAYQAGIEYFEATVLHGGLLCSRKGVNLPSTMLELSPLTSKDRLDLEFGLQLGVDFVALSFVQRPSDLSEVRALINDRTGLIAKIEKPQALHHLNEIVLLADAIMVARGDLGVEIPPEDVPAWQRKLIGACRSSGKPVIVATQMLDSMTVSPTPTRAEVSDVAAAIYDGADAVMLSAESASGSYPLESVRMMDRIIKKTEDDTRWKRPLRESSDDCLPCAIARASVAIAKMIKASAVVAFSFSGATAQRIASERSNVPLLVLTPSESVSRRLCLTWGVHAVSCPDVHRYEEMIQSAETQVVSQGFGSKGERIVVTSGFPFGVAGSTNNLRTFSVQ